MNKTALISGSKGQDASYLADLLLEKGYNVVSIDRRSSSPNYTNIQHLLKNPNYTIEQGDITDFGSVCRIVNKYKPDEFYNLAAQSFVGSSWDQAVATCNINFTGVCNCLEAVRLVHPGCRFYQASTSEVYGDVLDNKQSENTPARPRSPYAAAKHGAESLVKVYRDSYNMFACFGRLFNHESPRRGKEFVTRKITKWIGDSFKLVDEHVYDFVVESNPNYKSELAVMRTEKAFETALEKGIIDKLKLGNLDASRDWTHAKDMVRGMWMMLQQETPDDYVLASGKTWTIRQFLDKAFGVLDIQDWSKFVEIDPKFYRPADVALLCGDYTKAKEKMGWEPQISFDDLVLEMVNHDIDN
jgi:GDPmannose 4,6-dehydratase